MKIPDISSLVKKANYNTKISSLDGEIPKINSNAKNIENLIRKVLEFVFLLFGGNIMFNSEDDAQAYLIFQPLYRYCKTTNTNYILLWKSKGLSAESIKPPTTPNNSLNPELSYCGYSIRIKFTGSCLKQPKIMYTHKK